MTKLFFALAFIAANLPAQFPMRTNFAGARAAAVGPNGHVWIAGMDRVARFDTAGRNVFTTAIEVKFSTPSLAVESDGRAAVAFDDILLLLDPQGRIDRKIDLGAFPAAIAIDAQGNLFLAGTAGDAFIGQPGVSKLSFGDKICGSRNGDYIFCDDAFVAKFLPDGTRAWAAVFGGSFRDSAKAIALDPSGAIWIAGETVSPNMPVTANAAQPSYGGGESLGPLRFGDAFLVRVDSTASRLEYATYLGGFRYDIATALTVTAAGAVVAGLTNSPNFLTTPGTHQRALSSPQPSLPGSGTDAFVTSVSTSGELVYSTYFGQGARNVVSASTAGAGGEVGLAVAVNSQQCLLRLELRKFSPECFRGAFAPPLRLVFAQGEWLAIGSTNPGRSVPGVTQTGYTAVFAFGAAYESPAVAGVWNDYYGGVRPLLAPDSFISVYTTNPGRASVQLAGRELKILYSDGDQINAYVPSDVPIGLVELTVNGGTATPVDVVDRWPGLASAALNQDGTVNSASNPAEGGAIVSLFGTGFGPDPLPVIEPFIESPPAGNAQGMELLFAGRIAEGLFQVNARVPHNARTGHTAVRVVFRMPSGLLFSDLARIHVR